MQASPPLVQAWPAAQKLRRLSRFRIGLDVLIKNFEEKLNLHMLHGRRSINFGISAISFDNRSPACNEHAGLRYFTPNPAPE